jgi:hypothetical protein
MNEEPKIKPATFVAIVATMALISSMLVIAWCGDKMNELKTTIQVERAAKREQEAYLFTLQYRLAEANKLNGALELENETDCQ